MIRPSSTERIVRGAVLVTTDALLAWAALWLAVLLRRSFDLFSLTRSVLPPEKFLLDAPVVSLVAGTLLASMATTGFYEQRIWKRQRPLLLYALMMQAGLIALGTTVLERPYPRSLLLLVPLFEALILLPTRRLFVRLLPIRPRKTVIVGETAEISAIVSIVQEYGDRRLDICGLVSPSDPGVGVPWLGSLDSAGGRAAIESPDEVLCVDSLSHPEWRLKVLSMRGASGYLLVPTHADMLLTHTTFGWVGDIPLVEVSARSTSGLRAFVKRSFDIVFASAALAVASPFLLVIALLILIEDGRPVFLRQRRLGHEGREFGMLKFRTMRHRDDDAGELARDIDERVTRIGRWLRRHRLDELPQLLNIFTGTMSMVGPRPERPEITERILRDNPYFALRLLVRPGLAGLAQVSSEYDTPPSIKFRYDLAYICSWSFGLDLKILARAISTVFSGRGV